MPSINAIAIAIQTDQVGSAYTPLPQRVRVTQDGSNRVTQDSQIRVIQ